MYNPKLEWAKAEAREFIKIISFVNAELDTIFEECGIVCREREQMTVCQIIPCWTVIAENPCTPEQQRQLCRALARMAEKRRYQLDISFMNSRIVRFELTPKQFRQIYGRFLHIRHYAELGFRTVPKINWLWYELLLKKPLSANDDHRSSIEQYISLAEYGYLKVQMQLAYDYQHGLGHIARNEAETVKWYRRAAEQGCAEGQYQLALCYEKGCGVEQNYAEAAKWYHLAAMRRHVESSRKLGVYYRRGYGVERSDGKAEQYFRKYRFSRLLRKIGLGCPVFYWPHWDDYEI